MSVHVDTFSVMLMVERMRLVSLMSLLVLIRGHDLGSPEYEASVLVHCLQCFHTNIHPFRHFRAGKVEVFG